MSFPQLSAAVAGTGFIGPVHVEALRRLGVRVRGILGSTPEKGAATARALGLERGYENYDALLADPGVDVVHLTTPNRHHREMTLAALAHDKHVVCEKPLGMTARETAELVAAARAKPHLVTAVNYNVRFYPLMLHARDLIREGALGRLLHVRGAYLQDWLLKETDWNWRLDPEEGGELRAVGDIGTHWLDLIGFVTGLEIEAVFADLATFLPVRQRPAVTTATFGGPDDCGTEAGRVAVPVRTEDGGSVLLRFRGGARGALGVSQVNAGRKNQLSWEVAGTTGALAWNSERPNELWCGHRDRPNETLLRDPALLTPQARAYTDYPGGHNEGFPDTFKGLYRAVYGAVRDRTTPRLYADFADGHRELQLCEAILDSHRQERWVGVPSDAG